MNFMIGDIITWKSVLGERDYKVIDVLKGDLPSLLCTSADESGGVYTVMQYDAILKSRDENYKPKEYTRRIEKVNPLPNHITPRDKDD